jgi:hypothetical protein
MVFALPHRAHDLAAPPRFLAPKFQRRPFDDAFNFVVEVDPTGLNLREGAGVQGQSLRVLHDGENLSLARSPDSALGPSEVSLREFEGAIWLYVRADDGLEGWVNSTWLAWRD